MGHRLMIPASSRGVHFSGFAALDAWLERLTEKADELIARFLGQAE